MQKLVIEDDDGKQTIVPIVRDEITVGRQEGNTIRLTERNVSRRHARLVRENGHLFFEDVQARYGSKRNGEAVQGKVDFANGDVFLIGDYRLYLHSEHAPPPRALAQTQQESAVPSDKTAVIQVPTPGAATPLPGPGPAPDFARLVVLNTNLAGSQFNLPQPEVVIGRTPDNDIALDHRSISRHHAKITQSEGTFRVTDLGSANGIRVNGDPYSNVELRRGDILELGHIQLRFVAPGEAYIYQPSGDEMGASKGLPIAVIVLSIVVLLAAVAVVIMLVTGGEDEPTRGGAEDGGDDDTTTTEVDTGVADEPIAASDYSSLVLDAERLMNQAEWAQAIDLFSQVPVGHELFSRADNAVILARSERSTQETIYDPMLALAEEGSYADALAKLGEIPETSYYASAVRADGLEQAWLNAWVDESVSDSQMVLSENDFEAARGALYEVQMALPDDPRLAQQVAAIDSAEDAYIATQAEAERLAEEERLRREQERRDRRDRDPGPDTQTEPTPDAGTAEPELSSSERRARASELISEAQRLGLRRQHTEAIEILEQAKELNSRDHRIHMMLYRNYVGIGNERLAARSLERYLELRPTDQNADEYREIIEQLRGQ